MAERDLKKLRERLSSFKQNSSAHLARKARRVENAGSIFPFPFMVKLAMDLGTNCECTMHPMEKTHWSYHAIYGDYNVDISSRKFGMDIVVDYEMGQETQDEMVNAIKSTFPLIEKILQPKISLQIEHGQIVVLNRYHLYRDKYIYFKNKARSAFSSKAEWPVKPILNKKGDVVGCSQKLYRSERYGFYLSSACIDAFFQYIEHLLLLLYPHVKLIDNNIAPGKYFKMKWHEKLKKILGHNTMHSGLEVLASLSDIKSKYRDPLTHGGLSYPGDIGVLIEGVGYIPSSLHNYEDSINYSRFPISREEFDEACKIFSEVERVLRIKESKYAMRHAKSGLDVSYSESFIAEYSKAVVSMPKFEKWLDYRGYIVDRENNMDW